MDLELVGNNLRTIREARGMSKKELADKVNASQGTIKQHEDTGKIGVDYLYKYAEALGCTISDLTDGVVDREKFDIGTDLKDRYPYNVALAVAGEFNYTNALYHVYIPALLESLESLTEREKKVLKLRYQNAMTLEEVANMLGVTRERIRQIEARALRKLRHPRHWKNWKFDTMSRYIESEKLASELSLKNIELRKKLEQMYEVLGVKYPNARTITQNDEIEPVPIDEMELSVRSYNCLKRANINYVEDLKGYTVESLKKVRNLGMKSIREVVEKAREFGIDIPEGESEVIE